MLDRESDAVTCNAGLRPQRWSSLLMSLTLDMTARQRWQC